MMNAYSHYARGKIKKKLTYQKSYTMSWNNANRVSMAATTQRVRHKDTILCHRATRQELIER